MNTGGPMDGYPFFPMAIGRNGDERVIRNPATRSEYVLNGDSYRLLRLCDGRHSLIEVVARISRESGIGEEAVRTAAEGVLSMLTEMGLVWWRKEGAGVHPAPLPQHFYWDLTLACNLRCAHCVVAAGERGREELNTGECFRLLDELALMGVPMVSFSGGEPLMRPDFFDIARHAAARGMSLAVATNGTLIDDEVAGQFASLGMDVQVSLDGPTAAAHDRFRGRDGAFEGALRGIGRLRDKGVSFTIGSVLNRENQDRFGDILDLAIVLGARSFRLIPFIPFGRGGESRQLEPSPSELQEVTRSLMERRRTSPIPINDMEFEFTFRGTPCSIGAPDPLQRLGCDGGVSSFTITATGDVLPCSFFEGVKAMNVRERPFRWIWEHSPFLNYLRDLRARDIRGACGNCSWLAECLGGCPAANFAHGKMLQPNMHCWVAGSCSAVPRSIGVVRP